MGRVAILTVIALLAFTGQVSATPDLHVEVFTSENYPVTHPDVFPNAAVYQVDHLNRLLDRLSHGVPADPDQATQIVQKRLAVSGSIKSQIMDAGDGLARAYQYRLDRYPAVVINGQYLIYGVTDLQEVLNIYERSMK